MIFKIIIIKINKFIISDELWLNNVVKKFIPRTYNPFSLNKYIENGNIDKLLGDCTWVLPKFATSVCQNDSPPQ